jgi:hypothetical protein
MLSVMGESTTAEALEAELAEVCGHLNVLHARLVDIVVSAMESKVWEQWGLSSPACWLAWKAGLSRGQARLVVRLAERRVELPVTIAAMAAGELSLDRVPGWAEAEVCELAKTATVSQLRSVVSKYPFEDQPPTKAAPRREPYVGLTPSDDGTWRLSGVLDGDQGKLMEKALAEARDALYSQTEGAASNAEALLEICRRSLGSIASAARRERYRIHIHVDARTGATTDEDGVHVPDWVRRYMGCDATVGIVNTINGRPVATGDGHGGIPGVIRRHVLRRDRWCRVPGCQSRVIDLHHIVHREDGGDHRVGNLCGLCPRHHRMHHRGLLDIQGDAEAPDGLIFTNAHGVRLSPGPVGRPPGGPPPHPTSGYRHPTGETLQHDCVHFHKPTTTAG